MSGGPAQPAGQSFLAPPGRGRFPAPPQLRGKPEPGRALGTAPSRLSMRARRRLVFPLACGGRLKETFLSSAPCLVLTPPSCEDSGHPPQTATTALLQGRGPQSAVQPVEERCCIAESRLLFPFNFYSLNSMLRKGAFPPVSRDALLGSDQLPFV